MSKFILIVSLFAAAALLVSCGSDKRVNRGDYPPDGWSAATTSEEIIESVTGSLTEDVASETPLISDVPASEDHQKELSEHVTTEAQSAETEQSTREPDEYSLPPMITAETYPQQSTAPETVPEMPPSSESAMPENPAGSAAMPYTEPSGAPEQSFPSDTGSPATEGVVPEDSDVQTQG